MNEVIQTHSATNPNKIKWGPNEVQLKLTKEKAENAAWIEKMTNWQRSQWGKAGYKRDLATVKNCAQKMKPPRNAFVALGMVIGS